MNCPNCGTNANFGESFCRACGSALVNNAIPNNSNNEMYPNNTTNNSVDINNQYNYNNQQGMQNNYNNQQNQYDYNNQQGMQNNYNDEDLLDAYIGKNAEKIRAGGFSVCSLFFGMWYTMYRKMWLLSVLWYVSTTIVGIFLPSLSVLSVAINVFVAVKFNELYLKNARENINKIKINNPNKTKEELKSICTKKGGTTIVPIIIFGGLFALIFGLIIVGMVLAIFTKSTADYIEKEWDEVVEESNDIEEDSSLRLLEFDVPSNFEASDYNTDSYLNYSFSDDNDYCRLSISNSSTSIYPTETNYLEKNIYSSLGDVVSEISQTEINENVWYNLSIQKSYSKEYIYVSKHNNYIYEVNFVITDDGDYCSIAHNNIINSLDFD